MQMCSFLWMGGEGVLVYFKQAHFVVTGNSYTSLVLLYMFTFEELCLARAVQIGIWSLPRFYNGRFFF